MTMPRRNRSNTVGNTGMTGSVGTGKQGVKVCVLILAAGSYKGRRLASSTSTTFVGHLARSIMISQKKISPYCHLWRKVSSDVGREPGEKGKKWEVEVVTMARWR